MVLPEVVKILHLFDDSGGHVDSHVWSGESDDRVPGGRESGLTFQAPWHGTYDCHHERQPEPG
jgi:hypothetical protein